MPDLAIGEIRAIHIMLYHLIYVSTAVEPMTEQQLLELLQQSRERNEDLRITGMLLYKSGHFMQVLEGDESDVLAIFASIERDPRHRDIETLESKYIQYRDFPDWSMGFRVLSDLDTETEPGFTRFMEGNFRSPYFSENSVEAHAFLTAFKNRKDF